LHSRPPETTLASELNEKQTSEPPRQAGRRSASGPALKLCFVLATVFGIGYVPLAPGTAGSLFAIPLAVLMARLHWALYIIAWAALFALACYVSQKVRDALNREDPSIVVIDEVVGFLAAMFLVPVRPGYVVAAFLLFRAFDITKPYPASHFDKKVKSGIGIVMDDVVAGIYAGAILHLYIFFRG